MSDITDSLITKNQAAIRVTQICQQIKQVQSIKAQLPVAIERLKTALANDQTKSDLGANYDAVAAEINAL